MSLAFHPPPTTHCLPHALQMLLVHAANYLLIVTILLLCKVPLMSGRAVLGLLPFSSHSVHPMASQVAHVLQSIQLWLTGACTWVRNQLLLIFLCSAKFACKLGKGVPTLALSHSPACKFYIKE